MLRKLSNVSFKDLQFIDWRKVLVKAGNGGNGCAHLLRTAGNRRAGPDGGNGGDGGNVILEADVSKKHLRHVKKCLRAEDGGNGRTKSCHGRNGNDLIIKVPLGTAVTCDGSLLGDLKYPQDQLVVTKGGTGGYGNIHFKSSSNRRPLEFTNGEPGEEKIVELELKTIADIGLVGFPNAGKSTLLRAISNAKPAVASYPFTTRNPYVGMVQYEDYAQIAVADIPGLIQGAHMNKGLGHSFLRHVERCRCLLYVVDISQDNPLFYYEMLKKELDLYKCGLSTLPAAVILNKIDIFQDFSRQNNIAGEIREKSSLAVVKVSGKYGTNIVDLKMFIRQMHENHVNRRNNENLL